MPPPAGAEIVVDGHRLNRRVCHEPIDEVASDDPCPPDYEDAREPRHRLPSWPTDSHLVGFSLSFGWETRRCQITAHRPSVCGVMCSGYSGGTNTEASASRRVAPPSRPTMPNMDAPLSRASSSAATRLAETPRSRSPPPTEKTSSASLSESREPRSHSVKVVSQPSSFARAVSSLTLSVGAYASKPHSLR